MADFFRYLNESKKDAYQKVNFSEDNGAYFFAEIVKIRP